MSLDPLFFVHRSILYADFARSVKHALIIMFISLFEATSIGAGMDRSELIVDFLGFMR